MGSEHTRTEKVRELVQAKGADLLFLPSYSPDLNPIERGGFLQDQGAGGQGGGTHPRGISGSDRRSVEGRHDRRSGRVVRPCWLLATGSTLMSTAVRHPLVANVEMDSQDCGEEDRF